MVGGQIRLLGSYLRSVMTEAADFMCPRCTSRYKLVRVRANPELPSRLIHCRVCKEPFAPTDGEYVLKYFLVGKTKSRPDRGNSRTDSNTVARSPTVSKRSRSALRTEVSSSITSTIGVE